MKILISSGGTEEKIDEVRKITNMSSGALGALIADKLISNNQEVFYLCNRKSNKPRLECNIIETSDVNSVQVELDKLIKENEFDLIIWLMAISDYLVEGVYKEDINNLIKLDTSSKMKSNNEEVYIKLIKAPKIIDTIKKKSPKSTLISFKLMNNVDELELISTASKQLVRTKSDVVICNDLRLIREGQHKAFAVTKNQTIELNNKEDISNYISEFI